MIMAVASRPSPTCATCSRSWAEYGPGAMLGERAYLEGGNRTSTLAAVTACRAAAVDARQLDRPALEELSGGHRREDADLGLG